jgi:protein-disulfide isomerase
MGKSHRKQTYLHSAFLGSIFSGILEDINKQMEMQKQENQMMVPLAIVLAGLFIAVAIYFGGSSAPSGALTGNNTTSNELAAGAVVAPVSAADHLRGDPNAKVIVVTYTDFECPFCKAFHSTMNQIQSTYKSDEVALVYRQFPIVQLHSRAPKEAEASECVAELGGNTAFWKFADQIFATTGSNDTLDPAQLPIIAQASGVDVAAFNTCLSSGKYTSKVNDSVIAAAKAGAQGTPYSVAINKSGKKAVINGAEPFLNVKATIDSLLK